MQDKPIQIIDDSGDKNYFTIIPNYIANHSTANDQALYFQMKRFAGEKGICFASEKLLCEKLGIGRKALKTSISYLLTHNWIRLSGAKPVMTTGGIQNIKVYRMVDIWGINSRHFKGVSESTPPTTKGVSERAQGGAPKSTKGCLKEHLIRTIKKEPIKKNSISSFRKKPFYDGQEMREKPQGKWWVIPNEGGEWLEYAGKLKDIEWR